jgi:hypothetical protein
MDEQQHSVSGSLKVAWWQMRQLKDTVRRLAISAAAVPTERLGSKAHTVLITSPWAASRH